MPTFRRKQDQAALLVVDIQARLCAALERDALVRMRLGAEKPVEKLGFSAAVPDVLAALGARRDGTKEVLALVSGHRESEESWAETLRDLKKRGLEEPRLVVADGHLGIWGAVARVWPQAEHQRCFNHKLRNVLDKLPKKELETARALLKPLPYAATRAEAEALRDAFVAEYGQRAPKATACLLEVKSRILCSWFGGGSGEEGSFAALCSVGVRG
ncbi:transposase [Myxococcus sp. Y35]|uniref:transposase n=1 Tax=Pseudomyxococcus flavus TaxID=3115648 RepID=UPI003CF52705